MRLLVLGALFLAGCARNITAADVGGIFLAIAELGVLIILHEGGHFLLARLSGMRVDRFSVGFGPALFKIRRGETTYQISAIPLGGFVQIAGLNPGDYEAEGRGSERDGRVIERDGKFTPLAGAAGTADLPAADGRVVHHVAEDLNRSMGADDPRAYPNRPVWQRLLTIFAGPGTNYVFAALMMAFINVAWGVPVPGKMPLVGGLVDGKPAAAAGLELGDELASVDGKPVKDMNDVINIIEHSQGRPVQVVVVRETQEKTFTMKPEKDDKDGKFRIGVQLVRKSIREKRPFGESVIDGVTWPFLYTVGILEGFAEMFRGHQKPEFSGPVGIVRVMKGQIVKGTDSALEIMAIISVYLGLFNLFPLPALDGGRLVFLGYEAIRRRRVNPRFEQTVHMVGMLVLLCFLLYVTLGHDLVKLIRG